MQDTRKVRSVTAMNRLRVEKIGLWVCMIEYYFISVEKT
jgi:hypothetical protein